MRMPDAERLRRNRAWQLALRARRVAAGECLTCTAPVAMGSKYCTGCREANRLASHERYHAPRERYRLARESGR